MAFTIITQGTYVQPGVEQDKIIPLPTGCDFFEIINYTAQTSTGVGGVFKGEWYGGGITPQNDGVRWAKDAAEVVSVDAFSSAPATGGLSYFQEYPQPEAPLTGTTITKAASAVATVNNTYSDGDQVVIYNAVGMQQISGMQFTIASVTPTQFTLLGLDSTAFLTAATSFIVRRIAPFPRVAPPFMFVTDIEQAANPTVVVSQRHYFVVGQLLEFTVPGSFGMVQINNFNQPQSQPIMITEIVDDYSFKININSSGYSPFVFPLSSQSPVAELFATVAPAGQRATYNPTTGVQTGYNFLEVPFHSGMQVPFMYVPAGPGAAGGEAGDRMVWRAYKMETGTINSPVPS